MKSRDLQSDWKVRPNVESNGTVNTRVVNVKTGEVIYSGPEFEAKRIATEMNTDWPVNFGGC